MVDMISAFTCINRVSLVYHIFLTLSSSEESPKGYVLGLVFWKSPDRPPSHASNCSATSGEIGILKTDYTQVRNVNMTSKYTYITTFLLRICRNALITPCLT